MKELSQREDKRIAPADKGNAVVALDTNDYDRKAKYLIDNPPFQKVRKDPTRSVEGSLISICVSSIRKGPSSSCLLPRFMGGSRYISHLNQ